MIRERKIRSEVTPEMIERWFTAEPQPDGVLAIGEPYHFENVYSYLIRGESQDLLIDTGMGVGDIASFICQQRDSFAKKLTVVNSHWHFDHIGGNGSFDNIAVLVPKFGEEAARISKGWSHADLQKYGFESGFDEYGHPVEFDPSTFEVPPAKNISAEIDESWSIDLGGRSIRAIHTPGHTPGGVSFFDETNGLLFTSDLLYEGPLYAFEKKSDPKQYLRSLEKLRDKLGDYIRTIHPGHNYPNNENEPNLLYEAIWLFERISRNESPDTIFIEFPGVVEYRHPNSQRRLRALVDKNYDR